MTSPALPELKIVAENESVWSSALNSAGCPACRQAFLIPDGCSGMVCPHCAQDRLAPQPARLRPEPPELFIPFQLDAPRLQALLSAFIQPVRFRPDDMKAANLTTRLVKVFWPVWLVDSSLTGSWQAEVGYDYQVKSSQESFNNGEWRSQEMTETRIRWEPRLGSLIRSYNNIAVPAASYHRQRFQAAGAYTFDSAVNFDLPQFEGAIFQIPDQPPESVWPIARASLDLAAGQECQDAAGGQHIRNFQIDAQYGQVHWSQLLLPLYATYYTDDEGRQHPIWINAQNEETSGVRMASHRKSWLYGGLLAGASLLLLILALGLFLMGSVFPPSGAIALVLAFLAFALGATALVPILWAWQWNKRQVKN